jgi:hypothetical protein
MKRRNKMSEEIDMVFDLFKEMLQKLRNENIISEIAALQADYRTALIEKGFTRTEAIEIIASVSPFSFTKR